MTYKLHANEEGFQLLNDPKDVTSIALSNGWTSCGVRTYKLKEGANAATFATILTLPATNEFKIIIQTDLEALKGDHPLTLVTELADYPVSADIQNPQITNNFVVTI